MKNKTKKSNDKTIIALGYCKISWFISVELIVLSLQFQEIGNVLTPQDSRYFALPLPDRSSAALSATNKLFDLFWPKSYFTSFSLFLPLAKNILILVFSWKCLNPKSVEFVICRGRCSHVSWNKIKTIQTSRLWNIFRCWGVNGRLRRSFWWRRLMNFQMLTTQPCKVNCVVCYLHSVCDLRSILKLTLGSLALSIYLIQLSLLTFIFLWSSFLQPYKLV